MFTPTRQFALDWKPPSRRITFIWWAWVFYGGLTGLLAAFAVSVVYAESVGGEAGALLCLMLAPLFALAGAIGGYVAGRFGWARVRPALYALAGGVLLGALEPSGWALGGFVGGLLHGVLGRSPRRVVKGAVVGLVVGLVAWVVCAGWLAGVAEVIGE
jgi:hypothetical protein